jgi:hypothetical protein
MSDLEKTCTNITPRPMPRLITARLILATSEGVGSICSENTTLLAESLKTNSSAFIIAETRNENTYKNKK